MPRGTPAMMYPQERALDKAARCEGLEVMTELKAP